MKLVCKIELPRGDGEMGGTVAPEPTTSAVHHHRSIGEFLHRFLMGSGSLKLSTKGNWHFTADLSLTEANRPDQPDRSGDCERVTGDTAMGSHKGFLQKLHYASPPFCELPGTWVILFYRQGKRRSTNFYKKEEIMT